MCFKNVINKIWEAEKLLMHVKSNIARMPEFTEEQADRIRASIALAREHMDNAENVVRDVALADRVDRLTEQATHGTLTLDEATWLKAHTGD